MLALTKHIPPAAERTYTMREVVLVYFEKESKWIGPLIIADVIGRMIDVETIGKEKRQTFNELQ